MKHIISKHVEACVAEVRIAIETEFRKALGSLAVAPTPRPALGGGMRKSKRKPAAARAAVAKPSSAPPGRRPCGCALKGRHARTCATAPATKPARKTSSDDEERGAVRNADARVDAIVDALRAVDHDPEEPPARRRPGRPRKGAAMALAEMPVIPLVALVAMLAADRANNAVGDAGGVVLREDRGPSLVGHTTETRELCPVHGWVGRVAFERDGHQHCSVAEPTPAGDAPVVTPEAEPLPDVEPIIEEIPGDASAPRKRWRPRRSRPRSSTLSLKRLRSEQRAGLVVLEEDDGPIASRPRTREECRGQGRPCPWVACKHHLYLDINPATGSIKINFPNLEPWELVESCTLDVAERGAITLEEIGQITNLTRERIRQLEVRGLLKLKQSSPSPEELGTRPIPEDDAA